MSKIQITVDLEQLAALQALRQGLGDVQVLGVVEPSAVPGRPPCTDPRRRPGRAEGSSRMRRADLVSWWVLACAWEGPSWLASTGTTPGPATPRGRKPAGAWPPNP